AGQHGDLDGLSPDRRRLGLLEPAFLRSRHADPAAPGNSLYSPRVRLGLALPVGTAGSRGAQQEPAGQTDLSERAVILDPGGALFCALADARLRAEPLVAARG